MWQLLPRTIFASTTSPSSTRHQAAATKASSRLTPRIFPSGAVISQTSGHGDYRSRYEVPRGVCGHLSHQELMGAGAIADGVGEVLRHVPLGIDDDRPSRRLVADEVRRMAQTPEVVLPEKHARSPP